MAVNYEPAQVFPDAYGIPSMDRRLIASIFLATAAVCLLSVTLGAPQPTAIAWGSVALAVYCTALLLVAAVAAGHAGIGLATWKIGPWSLVWVAVTFGLATLSWIGPQTGLALQIALSSVLKALWLIAVAMTALTAGYCIGPRGLAERRAKRFISWHRRRFTDDIRSPWVPWILFSVGTTAQVVLAATTGRFGYVGDAASATTTASGYGQLLATAALCGPLSIAAAAVRVYRTQARGTRLTVSILFIAEISIGAAAGGKQSYVVAILAFLIPRAAARRRLPLGIIAGGAVIFMLIVIPFNQAYRSNARGLVTLSTGQAIATAPAVVGQVISDEGSPSVINTSLTYLGQRVREIDSPAIILQRTPTQIPYSSSIDLVKAPLAYVIPRALWPEKPILLTTYEFGQQYFGLPRDVFTSTAITPEGDLYRHGGWIPVIAGMFFFGIGIRILDGVLDVRANAHAAFLVIIIFPNLVKSEADWISLLAGTPALIILWAVTVMFSFARSPRMATERSFDWGVNASGALRSCLLSGMVNRHTSGSPSFRYHHPL